MSDDTNRIDPKIRFLISVPDWRPDETSPFQGFSPSLCRNSHFLRFVRLLPTDIFELTPESMPSRIARRIAGQLTIDWYGQSPSAIKSMPSPILMPFTVVFLDESEAAEDYQDWVAKSPGPATIVAKDGGHVPYDQLSYDRLHRRFRDICSELRTHAFLEGIEEAEAAIDSWGVPEVRQLPYAVGGHGTIFPNLAALKVCGFSSLANEPFKKHGDESAHIAQIINTCNSVLDEREANPPSVANQLFPRTPDVNLYLPATYDLKLAKSLRESLDADTKRDMTLTLRAIENQDSYSFEMSTPAQIKAMVGRSIDELKAGAQPTSNAIMRIRQLETHLGTEAVSCLAASEISSVIRLPNRLNRTRGIVRGFAQHYRADKPQVLKRAELFRGVQSAIGAGFPEEFIEIVERSRDGIRIIADAHVEWLDIKGIPLGLRYNVSRIPVTPGNLFIETIASKRPLLVTPEVFRNVLVISGLEENDVIAKQFQFAFSHFAKHWQDQINLKFVRVRSRHEMINAINEFEGMLMVFDGHGSHKHDEPGVLWLGDEPVSSWDLRGDITAPPPIVMLSACDTHAADRNHATVANGFLALGARSVIASVFPLHATHAAIFAARLLYRVAEFIPAAIRMSGRSITWLEVVSGMLRRQAMTDILNHLEAKGMLPEDRGPDFTTDMQMLVDVSGHDPFLRVQTAMLEWGISEGDLSREIQSALASSSTISYLHLGRPETILINSVENVRNVEKLFTHGGDPEPL